jgi:3-oxoisoapionate decarboxylase
LEAFGRFKIRVAGNDTTGACLEMEARIGFDQYTIDHRGLSPTETLEFARAHGLDGVQFLDPSVIDPRLDAQRLAEFRAHAEALGLYLEVGIPSPNPVRCSRLEGREITPAEHAAELGPYIDAAAALGCRHVRLYIGDRHDRFRTDTPWAHQIDASVVVLDHLTPRLKNHGLKVAVETHADLTVDEVLRLLDRLDPEIAGATLDTGNLVMRLDDPIRAAERLAPRVVCTHVKDCILERSPRGLRWQARPVGSGVLPLPDLLVPLLRANPSLHLTIELHPRTYDLPIHDASWLAFFPDLRPESLAAVLRLADLSEERFATGFLDRAATVEAIPWAERFHEWLASSLGYLRRVAPALMRVERTAGPSD